MTHGTALKYLKNFFPWLFHDHSEVDPILFYSWWTFHYSEQFVMVSLVTQKCCHQLRERPVTFNNVKPPLILMMQKLRREKAKLDVAVYLDDEREPLIQVPADGLQNT